MGQKIRLAGVSKGCAEPGFLEAPLRHRLFEFLSHVRNVQRLVPACPLKRLSHRTLRLGRFLIHQASNVQVRVLPQTGS